MPFASNEARRLLKDATLQCNALDTSAMRMLSPHSAMPYKKSFSPAVRRSSRARKEFSSYPNLYPTSRISQDKYSIPHPMAQPLTANTPSQSRSTQSPACLRRERSPRQVQQRQTASHRADHPSPKIGSTPHELGSDSQATDSPCISAVRSFMRL